MRPLSWVCPRDRPGPPRRSAGKTLRLAFFTDVHASPDWDTPVALAKAAKAINAERPELVIAGGDLIYDGFEVAAAAAEPQWDVYMAMHRAIRAPVEPILGNHDLVAVRPDDGSDPVADPRSVFREKLGLARTWRVIDAEGYRFFLLDSVEISDDELMYHGGISTEQLAWLETELGRTDTDTPIVVATHIPFLSAIPQATKGAMAPLEANHLLVNNREVLELFAEHNLLLVLQGHLHAEEMLALAGNHLHHQRRHLRQQVAGSPVRHPGGLRRRDPPARPRRVGVQELWVGGEEDIIQRLLKRDGRGCQARDIVRGEQCRSQAPFLGTRLRSTQQVPSWFLRSPRAAV